MKNKLSDCCGGTIIEGISICFVCHRPQEIPEAPLLPKIPPNPLQSSSPSDWEEAWDKKHGFQEFYDKHNAATHGRSVKNFIKNVESAAYLRGKKSETEARREVIEEIRKEIRELIEYEEVKEIWCPKQNVRLREYWSHHDEGTYCENCGAKVEVRTKREVKNWPECETISQITDILDSKLNETTQEKDV